MVERTVHAKTFPVQLVLDSGHRIVTSQFETVLGWAGSDSEGAPLPLSLPESLLAACPTSSIVYGCNLPAAPWDSRTALFDVSGQLPGKIGRDLEGDFLAASYPGGQAAIIYGDGRRIMLRLRWVCLTAHFSIGAVWRCFARAGGGLWRAVGHDYIFEAGGGAVLNSPGEIKIPLGADFQDVKLRHPEGMLTCFPCLSGRVKVTRLSADGWAKRHLLSLMLDVSNKVVAMFSDGTQRAIATAAPSQQQAARAA
jgi:hypothetical protein